MKKIILILFILIPKLSAQWVECNNGLLNKYVRCMVSIGDTIYAGTSNGIFMSSDFGENWIQKNTGLTNLNIWSLSTDGNIILAGTKGNGLYKSSDSGENWQKVNIDSNTIIVLSSKIIGNYVFVGTDRGLYLSSDYGLNWINVDLGELNLEIYCIEISGVQVIIGTNNGAYKSYDNGKKWILTLHYERINSLKYTSKYLLAGSLGFGLWLSGDFGDSWGSNDEMQEFKNIYTISCNNELVIFGSDGFLFINQINSNWFSKSYNFTTCSIYSSIIVNNYIFAGTWGDGIYKAKKSDLTTDIDYSINEDNHIFSISPNPITNQSTIKYSVDIPAQIKLTLLNSLSQEIAILDDGFKDTGEQTLNFSTEEYNLTDGLYFVRLVAGDKVNTEKMIILK